MPVACYRGLTSRFVYRFLYGPQVPLPVALADPFGNPTTGVVTFNGETVVPANNDGSVAQSVIGGPPVGDPHSFTKSPGLWETQSSDGSNLLTANQSSIEVDASGWLDEQAAIGFPASCTLTLTTNQALYGVSSLQITGTGGIVRPQVSTSPLVITSGRFVSGGVAAFPGLPYTGLVSLRSATTARSASIGLIFVDAAGNVLLQVNPAFSDTRTSAWTQYVAQAVAPGGVSRVIPLVSIASVPNGEAHYLDGASVAVGTSLIWRAGTT